MNGVLTCFHVLINFIWIMFVRSLVIWYGAFSIFMLAQFSKAGKSATQTDINICFLVCVFFGFFIFFAFFLQFLSFIFTAIFLNCYTIIIMVLSILILAIFIQREQDKEIVVRVKL